MSGPAARSCWLGTPLVFYMYIAPPMSHATSAFAVAAFLLRMAASSASTWSVGGSSLLGILAAVLAMVREQDAFFVAAPALDFTCGILVRRRTGASDPLMRGAVAGTMAAVIAYLPQAFAYLALNGHVGPSHLVARKMSWTAPHALDVLASPTHGFLCGRRWRCWPCRLVWLPGTAPRTRAIGIVTISLALAVACRSTWPEASSRGRSLARSDNAGSWRCHRSSSLAWPRVWQA